MEPTKIFIVEDEAVEALALTAVLEKLGYIVVGEALSGSECIEKVPHLRPDLIIMDIKLQGEMDGIDTAWDLRSISDAPVIFVTAMSDESSLNRAKITEPYGYIVKPYNERELYTTIETSLHRNWIDRRMRDSETKYRALFEQSPDAIFISSADGTITDVNPAMKVLAGYEIERLKGMSILDLFVLRTEGERLLADIHGCDCVENRSVRLRKSDGTESECLLTLTRIVTGKGTGFLCQGIIRDVTVEKRLERVRDVLFHEKIKRVKELNCLYRLATISGNIKTPLEDMFLQTAEVVPTAFQNPGLVSVRIRFDGGEYESPKFVQGAVSLAAALTVFGKEAGSIEIFHAARPSGVEEDVFTKEDRDLLGAIAERLGIVIERKKTFEDLAGSREELRSLSTHLQSLREEERTAIAREIHDALGQSLTAMKLDLSWIKNRLEGQGELVARAEAMGSMIDATINTVRRISGELRPGLLDDIGLLAAIEWYAGEFEKRSGIACRVSAGSEEPRLDEKVSINIYRIVQESLTNIIRHANATAVDVDLVIEADDLTLTIRDNGRGITGEETSSARSLGLIGIRERALSCGGTIAIEGEPGRGTVVTAHIPLGGNS
jgi:PAS domain S-box-containing protein